jgi:hypothetical protein
MARLLLALLAAVAVVMLVLLMLHVLFFGFWIVLLGVVVFGVFRLGRWSGNRPRQ